MTTLYDLGFDSLLDRGLPSLSSSLQSNITDAVNLAILGSGELTGNMTMVTGLLKSSNYVSGSAGWQLTYDGELEAELQKMMVMRKEGRI